jgi:sugar lactone lactonase YvrE
MLAQRIGMACLALGTVACTGDSAGETRRADGAVVIRNHASGRWTDAERWRVVQEGPIAEAPDEPLVFPSALEADASGTLYVLDAGSQRIHVYDGEGRRLRAFGRSGGGPGEFKQAMGMTLAPDGNLWVMDPGNMRYTVFAPDGAVLATHRRDGTALHPWPGRFDAQGRLWDVAEGADGLGTSPTLVRRAAPGAAGERFALPAFARPQWSLKNGSVQTKAFVPYSPALVWAVNQDGRVWSGVSSDYRLALHEPGGDTLRIAELPLAPVPVTAPERETAARELKWFTDQGGRVDLGQIPRQKPAFTSIEVDDQGYLWIRPALPEGTTGSAFDVLDPGGEYLGRVRLPVFVDDRMPVRVRGDRIYAVVLGADDVPQVVRFRIQGRAPAQTRVAARR